MSVIQHADLVHQATVNVAEMARQVAVTQAVAAGGGDVTVKAAVKAAELTFYRACVASCLARNLQSGVYRQALRDQFGVWS